MRRLWFLFFISVCFSIEITPSQSIVYSEGNQDWHYSITDTTPTSLEPYSALMDSTGLSGAHNHRSQTYLEYRVQPSSIPSSPQRGHYRITYYSDAGVPLKEMLWHKGHSKGFSYSTPQWSQTYGDYTIEKTEYFNDDSLLLAVKKPAQDVNWEIFYPTGALAAKSTSRWTHYFYPNGNIYYSDSLKVGNWTQASKWVQEYFDIYGNSISAPVGGVSNFVVDYDFGFRLHGGQFDSLDHYIPHVFHYYTKNLYNAKGMPFQTKQVQPPLKRKARITITNYYHNGTISSRHQNYGTDKFTKTLNQYRNGQAIDYRKDSTYIAFAIDGSFKRRTIGSDCFLLDAIYSKKGCLREEYSNGLLITKVQVKDHHYLDLRKSNTGVPQKITYADTQQEFVLIQNFKDGVYTGTTCHRYKACPKNVYCRRKRETTPCLQTQANPRDSL